MRKYIFVLSSLSGLFIYPIVYGMQEDEYGQQFPEIPLHQSPESLYQDPEIPPSGIELESLFGPGGIFNHDIFKSADIPDIVYMPHVEHESQNDANDEIPQNSHEQQPINDKLYHCEDCNKTYLKYNSLYQHIRRNHQLFFCVICETLFIGHLNFRKHKKTHNEKPEPGVNKKCRTKK